MFSVAPLSHLKCTYAALSYIWRFLWRGCVSPSVRERREMPTVFEGEPRKSVPLPKTSFPTIEIAAPLSKKATGIAPQFEGEPPRTALLFCLSRYFLMHSSFDSPLATPLRHVRASIRLLRVLLGTFGLHFASWHSSRPRSDLLCLKGRTHSIRPSRPRGSLLSSLFSFVSYRHYERLSVLR